MSRINRIARCLGLPVSEITQVEVEAIKKARTASEVCRILGVDISGNVKAVKAAMKPRKTKKVQYAFAA